MFDANFGPYMGQGLPAAERLATGHTGGGVRVPLEPGDEVAGMIRIEKQLLIVTKYGHFFEVFYEGMGCYRIQAV